MSGIEIGAKWRHKNALHVAEVTSYNMSENEISLKGEHDEYVYSLDMFPRFWELIQESPSKTSIEAVEQTLDYLQKLRAELVGNSIDIEQLEALIKYWKENPNYAQQLASIDTSLLGIEMMVKPIIPLATKRHNEVIERLNAIEQQIAKLQGREANHD